MTARSLDDLIKIASNGGSLDVQAANLTKEEIEQLARNMRGSAKLILRGLETKSTGDLADIAGTSVADVIFVID